VVETDGDEDVSAAIAALGPEETRGLVFAATAEPTCWAEAEDRLVVAFERTKEAAESSLPVVYLVREEDLGGTRGPLAAAIAGALLSFARALAMERAGHGQVANVVSFGPATDPGRIAATLRFLLDPAAPTGGLIDLGANHFGRSRA